MTTEQDLPYPPERKQKFFYGYVIVVASILILIASQSTRFAFGVFFKPVLTEFGWTRAMTSSAFSLCTIMEGFFSIVMGGLTDRLGPRKVLTISGFLISLGVFLTSRIDSIWQFYLFYGVIVGMGMGGMVIPLMPTVARWFVKRRNTMIAITLSGISVGALVGPLLADALINAYHWRTSYVIISLLVFVVVIGAAQLLKRDPRQMGQIAYGENQSDTPFLKSTEEGKSVKEALRTRPFWMVLTIALCLGFLTNTVTVHFVPNAVDLGIPATTAARILSLVGITMTIGRLAIGSSADIIGIKRIYIICITITTATLFELAWAKDTGMFYLFAIVFGLAEGGAAPLVVPALAGIYGLESLGLLAGICGLGMTIGAATGPPLSGYLFDVMGNYQVAFLICAGFGIIGLISALLLPHIKNKPGQTGTSAPAVTE